jgi:hypothetical protein
MPNSSNYFRKKGTKLSQNRPDVHTRLFITYGPDQFKSKTWDLMLMTLNYQGQVIDLSWVLADKEEKEKQFTPLQK